MSYEIVRLTNENRIQSLNSSKRLDARWNKPKRKYKKHVNVESIRLRNKYGYNLDDKKLHPQALRQCC